MESGERKPRRGCCCFRAATVPVAAGIVALVLVSTFVPLLAGVALTTASGNANARDLTRRSAAVESAGIATLVEMRLEAAERIAHEQSALFLQGAVNVSLPRTFLAALRALGPVNGVSITTPEGRIYGFLHTPDNRIARWFSWDENYTTCQITVDPDSVDLLPIAQPDWCDSPYEGNSSVWFNIVDPSVPGDCRWTPLFIKHEVFVTYSLAARDELGRFVGVIAIDFILGFIRKIVADVEINGIGVLLERDTEIFLGSTDESLNAGGINHTTGDVLIHNMTQIASTNELILAAQEAMLRKYGSWAAAYNTTFWSAAGTDVVSVTSIKRAGLEWLLIVVIRPSFVTVDIKALGTVLGITILLVFLAIVASWLFVRPINSLSADMAAISQLDFSAKHTKQRPSVLREVREMQKSFLRLRTGARALTRYVPSEVALDVMRNESCDFLPDMKLLPLTILFADLKGFTSLSETLPHEILVAILNRWFQEFGKVIQANGGVIDKFIGDSCMALYGAPTPIESHELAACRTALEFKRAMELVNDFANLHGIPPIEYRVGIHSGKVLVGHLGYSEHVNYTVCGNAANVASRMEQLGKEFGITPLVSGDVAAKVDKEFLCVFLDVVFLRGHKNSRTRVYHLLAPRATATQAELEIVHEFDTIHAALRAGEEPAKVLERIKSARRKPLLEEHRKALAVLQKHVRSGTTSKLSYI